MKEYLAPQTELSGERGGGGKTPTSVGVGFVDGGGGGPVLTAEDYSDQGKNARSFACVWTSVPPLEAVEGLRRFCDLRYGTYFNPTKVFDLLIMYSSSLPEWFALKREQFLQVIADARFSDPIVESLGNVLRASHTGGESPGKYIDLLDFGIDPAGQKWGPFGASVKERGVLELKLRGIHHEMTVGLRSRPRAYSLKTAENLDRLLNPNYWS